MTLEIHPILDLLRSQLDILESQLADARARESRTVQGTIAGHDAHGSTMYLMGQQHQLQAVVKQIEQAEEDTCEEIAEFFGQGDPDPDPDDCPFGGVTEPMLTEADRAYLRGLATVETHTDTF